MLVQVAWTSDPPLFNRMHPLEMLIVIVNSIRIQLVFYTVQNYALPLIDYDWR